LPGQNSSLLVTNKIKSISVIRFYLWLIIYSQKVYSINYSNYRGIDRGAGFSG